MEEQREGARANDKKKNLMGGPLSELDAKGEGRLKQLTFIVSGRADICSQSSSWTVHSYCK